MKRSAGSGGPAWGLLLVAGSLIAILAAIAVTRYEKVRVGDGGADQPVRFPPPARFAVGDSVRHRTIPFGHPGIVLERWWVRERQCWFYTVRFRRFERPELVIYREFELAVEPGKTEKGGQHE